MININKYISKNFDEDLKFARQLYSSGELLGMFEHKEIERNILVSFDLSTAVILSSEEYNSTYLSDILCGKEWNNDKDLFIYKYNKHNYFLNAKNINESTVSDIRFVSENTISIVFGFFPKISTNINLSDLDGLPCKYDILSLLIKKEEQDFSVLTKKYEFLDNYINSLTKEEKDGLIYE